MLNMQQKNFPISEKLWNFNVTKFLELNFPFSLFICWSIDLSATEKNISNFVAVDQTSFLRPRLSDPFW